jgi:N-acetylglucosaminyldiphosphoundecaprenol N-acetyl-beta-D-mannosaminyltransferase
MIVGASERARRAAEEELRKEGVRVLPGASPEVSPDGTMIDGGVLRLPTGGVVLVALGAPKQELWIRRQIREGAPANIYVGVGGVVDYISGLAPEPWGWARSIGLEWLYRLIREPRRRGRRQLTTLPNFLWHEVLRPVRLMPIPGVAGRGGSWL